MASKNRLALWATFLLPCYDVSLHCLIQQWPGVECDVTIKINMAARKGNLVAGEASESDEEYEINQSSYFMKNTMVANEETTQRASGIVVEGEASESDEEETEDGEEKMPHKMESILTEAKEAGSKEMTDEQTRRKVKFHYDS